MTFKTDFSPFQPPFWLRNPHLQSILPKFIPQTEPNYQRILQLDNTGQCQIAYDFVYHSHAKNPQQLAVMFHGLEGSSDSHYAKAFVNYAHQQGWNAVIVHYRGCGGVENSSPYDYHAGDTASIQHSLTWLKQQYAELYVTGVSLGGNMLARYLGEYAESALCKKAVIISAPVDLASSAKMMHRFVARHVYTPYLLKPLLQKALAKIQDPVLASRLKKVKSIDDFDDLYTAPRHDYMNVKNYYQRASALPVLKSICIPTLVISAVDDPFLGQVAQSHDISNTVQLCYPKYGGHVGFIDYHTEHKKFDLNWLPKTVFQFFDAN